MKLTLGIDEVGRGAWAGPLVVGAVVLDMEQPTLSSFSGLTRESSDKMATKTSVASDWIAGSSPAMTTRKAKSCTSKLLKLDDSKKLTVKQREILTREIDKRAAAIGIGWVDASIIDKIGLAAALKLATKNAHAQILQHINSDEIGEIIIDGTVNFLDDPRAITMIKADGKIAAVSAASIVAKVFRDHYMAQLTRVFPDYDFARHVGYGTKLHQEKLAEFGVIAGIHRQSFAPIKKVCHPELVSGSIKCHAASSSDLIRRYGKDDQLDSRVKPENDKTRRGAAGYSSGHSAENLAAEFLKQHGHQIIVQNWKTRFCEIDIISEHGRTLYFVEVKYRENARHGDGLAAITPKKLKQIKFAAEIFLSQHHEFTKDYDVKIAVISLSQNPPQIDEFLDNVI